MPRPDVSAERTEQILLAAFAVFSRQGFAKTRMEDIALEAGLSKGTLYLYFKSKDELTGAILNAFLGRELVGARKLLEGKAPAAERLVAFTEIVVEDLKQMQPLIPLYFEIMAMAGRNLTGDESFAEQPVSELLQSTFYEFMEVVEALVEQGIDRGEFRPVDARMAALAIGTLIDGTALMWIYDSDLVNLEGQTRNSVQLLLDGLKRPD